MVARAAVAGVLIAAVMGACGAKPRGDEPAPAPPVRGDAARDASASGSAVSGSAVSGSAANTGAANGSAASGSAASGSAANGTAANGAAGATATGDLQIRVEWRDVPVAARSSPGRTPCNTPRSPAVSPTTTWGVPDALVIVDGAPPTPSDARITLADCTLTPRIAVGATLAITSAVDHPARVVLHKRGSLAQLVPGDPVPVALPIAGHTVTTALEPGAIYSVETDAPEPEVAFVASLPGAYLTEASGQVTVHGLTVGTHAVTAWLPPRAGQPARTGRATATITANDLAELTVPLAP